LLIRALLQAFVLTSLALEWPDDLAPTIAAFLAGEPLADHESLWSGDGRITAGHLAVLAERAAAGPLELILFDGAVDAGSSWSQRDEAMAGRILAATPAGTPTLAVAGSYHTATSPIELGVPMGAVLAGSGPASGRSGSATAAGISTTPGHASSTPATARSGKCGSTGSAAS
jgi:hypothetical protein